MFNPVLPWHSQNQFFVSWFVVKTVVPEVQHVTGHSCLIWSLCGLGRSGATERKVGPKSVVVVYAPI